MKDEVKHWCAVAAQIACASKDPKTKVGAVIVDADQRIVSTGFNGMIYGVKEDDMWKPEHKYNCVIHAEMNAIMFARRDLRGCRLYSTLAPCANCLKHCFQAGIRVIRYVNIHKKVKNDVDQVSAIKLMIMSLNCSVEDLNGTPYVNQLDEETWGVGQ